MIETLDQIRTDLDGLKRRLTRVRAQHVNSRGDKEAIRLVVNRYFSEHRMKIANTLENVTYLDSLDRTMQNMLRHVQRRAQVSDYKRLLQVAKTAINEIEIELTEHSKYITPFKISGTREERIVETLKKLNQSAAACYEQGLIDLLDQTRKSWRGTVVEFREALRETLDTLAPDEEVKKNPSFQLEKEAKGPTMKQKVKFVLMSRKATKSQAQAASNAVNAAEEIFGSFARSVYERASSGVHTTITRQEAFRVKDYVTMVLADLLEVEE